MKGRMLKEGILGVIAISLSSQGQVGALSASSPAMTLSVPAPTGPNRVGTTVMQLVDTSRSNPFMADGTKRELPVRFWYPTPSAQPCRPALYTSPVVWTYLTRLAGLTLPDPGTNSCLDAPVLNHLHPVIIFSHGYTGMFTDATYLLEELASRGFVVASIAHTYESTAVEFPDGRFVRSVLGSYLASETVRFDTRSISHAYSVRIRDLTFVLDELQRMNTSGDSPFAGKLDLSRIAVVGYSLGGGAAMASAARESRIRSAIALNPILAGALTPQITKPILILRSETEEASHGGCNFWSNLGDTQIAVDLPAGDHFTLSDAVWLFKSRPDLISNVSAIGAEKTIAVVRECVTSFLDSALLGRAAVPLLRGISPKYPGVNISTRGQTICADQSAVGGGGLQ